jgi:hypothetical protein
MAFQYHKRSVSSLNSDQLHTVKINRSNIQISRSLLPPNVDIKTDNRTPKKDIQKTITYFKTSDENDIKNGKFSSAEVKKNRNSLIKSGLNMPTSTANKSVEAISKKPLSFKSTSSNKTGLPTNFLNKYKLEKLKTNNNLDIFSGIKIDLNNTPEKILSKGPIIKRNIKNDKIMKMNENIKNIRSVSPIKVKGTKFNKHTYTVKHNNRDNKFSYNTELREINTSPLLIKVFNI